MHAALRGGQTAGQSAPGRSSYVNMIGWRKYLLRTVHTCSLLQVGESGVKSNTGSIETVGITQKVVMGSHQRQSRRCGVT